MRSRAGERQLAGTAAFAIANAAAGNAIVVGPGRYGDLKHNGNFSDPGDQAAQLGTGCPCI